ncbi:MAG TPA: protealysin inhibitor emfourin [Anaerolineales bacterium]|nr:protealysin inhibitor emfourin [Anaerolineales bacterium]
MTTIFFKRSGGFVGQGMRFHVDLDRLPVEYARDLTHLIEQAEFFNLPENFIIKFNPNEYQYTITVESGEICHTVRANDSTMPAPLRPLVDQLSSLKSVAG